MTHTLITIHPDGRITEAFRKPTLEALQATVGGYIEKVPYFSRLGTRICTAWANEEGRLNGLPPNPKASELWALATGWPPSETQLVGPIVIQIKGQTSFKECVE